MIAIKDIKLMNYRHTLTAAELQLDNCDIFTKSITGNKEGVLPYIQQQNWKHTKSPQNIIQGASHSVFFAESRQDKIKLASDILYTNIRNTLYNIPPLSFKDYPSSY